MTDWSCDSKKIETKRLYLKKEPRHQSWAGGIRPPYFMNVLCEMRERIDFVDPRLAFKGIQTLKVSFASQNSFFTQHLKQA